MMFVPFLELKMKQDMNKVENGNIGMGLAGSHDITQEMGGDITLKHSEYGLTVFSFKIPVKSKLQDQIYSVDLVEQMKNS